MFNKFNWINSKLEYTKMLAYLDREIKDMQSMPDTIQVMEKYIRYINDRDELLDLAIKRGY